MSAPKVAGRAGSASIPDPRIEERVGQIGEEVRDNDPGRDTRKIPMIVG
jgi:hypothetical protein